MIKIEHSIFALPFAMLGMIWASNGWPGWWKFGWIVVAMVSCRSAAMAWNRIADREIDALNPRTKMRAIPSGILSLRTSSLFFFGSIAVFLIAAGMLNPLALALSPVALFVTLGYSMCKRFTSLCHFVLGLSLGIAPAAAWIGVTGTLDPRILPVVGAVLCWTGGFDILYALQDAEFDREHNLHSLPARIGVSRSLIVSRVCHVVAIVLLAIAGVTMGCGWAYFAGVAVAASLLTYEQSLVKPSDLSRINLAFFTLNGYVSLGVFAFSLIDLLIRSPKS